jgi:hypothetical protein
LHWQVDKRLARCKVAYKYESGWELGTFRGMYTGRKKEFKGFSTIVLDRKTALYLDLQVENYDVDKDWVIIKKL